MVAIPAFVSIQLSMHDKSDWESICNMAINRLLTTPGKKSVIRTVSAVKSLDYSDLR